MKRICILTLFLFGIYAVAQQPQAPAGTPLYGVNAAYTNGVGPGYWPTAGSGLTLDLSNGSAFCSGSMVTYSASTLTMTASSTNYVYLNASSSCAPASNTTGFSASNIPIATVTTSGTAITAITDDRTMQVAPSSGGGGVTWPTSGDAVISNGTSSPSGVAEVDGDCLLGSGGAWTAGSCGSGSGGTSVEVNGGSSLTTANFNGATPAAPSGDTNVVWQVSGSSVSGYVAPIVADSSFTVGTTAVSANSCTSSSTVTMTGVTTSMAFFITPSASTASVTGWGSTGGLVIMAWPTSNTLNYEVCNQTATLITPSASVTFNVGAR